MNNDLVTRLRVPHLVLLASIGVFVAACGSSPSTAPAASTASIAPTASIPSTTSSASIAPTTSATPAQEVDIQNYAFPAITTAPGATLTLVDRDDEPHTFTADNGEFRVRPYNPQSPGTLVAPMQPGTYPFHCEIHPTMHGNLVVRNP